MVKLLKYSLSIAILLMIMACNQIPLSFKLNYQFTSEERDSLEARLSEEVKHLYEGSLLRQTRLDTLIALNPDEEEYYRLKSFKFTRTGNLHLSYPLIQKAVQLDPLDALYFTSWQMLFLYRDYKKALEDFQYYDDIMPGTDYVWGENVNYLKGLALKQMHRYDEAVVEFDRCIIEEGKNVSEYVFVYRGIANLRNECLEVARMDFLRAIEAYANCTMAYVYLAETEIDLGDYQSAMSRLWIAEDLLCKGIKKTHPYFEVFDEVQLSQIYDLMAECQPFL